MDNQAEERGNGVPQDVGRLINTISHQLKRQMCAEEENDSLTNMQRHILHYILFQSLKKKFIKKTWNRNFRSADRQLRAHFSSLRKTGS